MLKYTDKASLVVRPFIPFEAWQEWRVFVKDNKIVGISQYYYLSTFEKLTPIYVKQVQKSITDFIDTIVIPNMAIPNYIADVVVDGTDVKLLETNPWGLSDPCLFGSYENFNGDLAWKMPREGVTFLPKYPITAPSDLA